MKIKMLLSLRHWSRPRREALVDKAIERSVALGYRVIGFALGSLILALCARGIRTFIQFALAIVAIGPQEVFMFAGFGLAKLAQTLGWSMWAFKRRGWMDERADDVDKLVKWCGSARVVFTEAFWCLPGSGWSWSWTWAARIAAVNRLVQADSNAWGN